MVLNKEDKTSSALWCGGRSIGGMARSMTVMSDHM